MSHLILIYSVCSLDFEFSVQYGLKPTFFKFADVNCFVYFLVLERVSFGWSKRYRELSSLRL